MLRYKVKSVGSKVIENSEKVEKPRLHHNDLAVLEEELKPECDVLNSLAKALASSRLNFERLSGEYHELVESLATIKTELNGKKTSNQSSNSCSSLHILSHSST